MKTWRLKKGGERRIRAGHPWVFAGELDHSPREIEPGEVVELRDASGHFVAYGYGHPSAQICFRKLSAREKDRDLLTVDYFIGRLQSAIEHRRMAGWESFSHRMLFGEADQVPGLVIDMYKSVDFGPIAVVQASTAGMERSLPQVYAALEAVSVDGEAMTVIESPTSRNRLLEGLKIGEKRVVFGQARAGFDGEFDFADDVRLRVDLIHGQKTGFFLDQQWNVRLLKKALKNYVKAPDERIKVLDICCYVGQWGSHVAAELMSLGRGAAVTVVDSSESALSFAKHNVSRYAGDVRAIQGDALKVLGEISGEQFDVVICDPPAFVKKKADLEAGLRAYVKLNRDALRLLRPGGLYVASSCSGLVRGEDWRRILTEASLKAGRPLRRLFGGGHGPDHPVRPEFPEGEYLKCEILL